MTSGEKALYHSIIEQLKDKELSDSQKDNFVKKPVSYTHLRAHETRHDLVCRLLLEKKKKKK